MFYAVYLLFVLFYLFMGIGGAEKGINFVDQMTLRFVAVPCILMLFCTKSFRAFGRAFLFAFGKRDQEISKYQESAQSVKMVMVTAHVFGMVCFLIGMINAIRFTDWSSPDCFGWLCMDLSVAVLSLFYPLFICMILLPVFFMLKRHLS